MALTSYSSLFKLTPVSFSMKSCNVSVAYESRMWWRAGFFTSGTLRDTPNRCVAYSWRTAGNYLTYSAIYITVYIVIKQANQYISSRSGENFKNNLINNKSPLLPFIFILKYREQ